MRRCRLGSSSASASGFAPLVFALAAFSALRAAFFGFGGALPASSEALSASLAPRHMPTSTEYKPVITDALVGEHNGFTRNCVNRMPAFPMASIVGVCRSVFQYEVQ